MAPCFRPLFASLLLVNACSSDMGEESMRETEVECEPLTLGHCIDTATGQPCTDFAATTRTFVPLSENNLVQPIIGFQGSAMFVLGARAEKLAPGEGSEAPLFDVDVSFEGESLGGYQSRPALIPDTENQGWMLSPQMYVIAFYIEEYIGETLAVTMSATDRNGRIYCGSDTLVTGELIVPEDYEDPHS